MYITVAMVIVVCMLFFGIYLIGARRIGDMLEMSGMNGDIGESITLKFCDIAVSVLPLVTAMGIGYFPEYVVDFSPTHHVSMVVLVTIPFIQFFGLFCDVILCDVHYDAKNHAGAELFRQALSKAPDKNALFPYAGLEEDSRDMVTKKYDFCESQRVFLKDLLKDACQHYDKLKYTTDPKKNDYFELQTAVRVVILWLAMHKVSWAIKKYYDGSLMTDNKGEVQKHFPLGYFYSNIDTNYFHDIALRNKAYAYSIEKANKLLQDAEFDRAKMIQHMSEAKK